jgi:hypothetical protein
MTATDAPGDRPLRPWAAWVARRFRWLPDVLMWTGHYAIYILLAYAAGAVAYNVSGRLGWLSWPVTALAIAWIVSFSADMSYHESRLCERCIAATPLDPQKAVDRWRPALRLFHRKNLYVGTLLAMIAWIFLSSIFLPGKHGWTAITDTIIVAVIVVSGGISWTHRRLYPWCPWCRWGKGGHPEVVPDPDPEDHGVKPVPA